MDMDSPVSNNGRGLKLGKLDVTPSSPRGDSPVSNNGRGLKPPVAITSFRIAVRFAR